VDFGKGIIPQLAGRVRMSCYPFDGYWKDVGTIAAFYEANMDWRAGGGIADMFQDGTSIITHSRQLPPSRIQGTAIEGSLVADGCCIAAKAITRSIIGVRSRVGPGSVVEDSILMGNDEAAGPVPFEIGADCRIRKAIVDKNAVIGDNSVIENAQGVREAETDLYVIRSGIVVVPRGAVIPPGTRI
jgi:glucose-1-phosphate adenylyltransferase